MVGERFRARFLRGWAVKRVVAGARRGAIASPVPGAAYGRWPAVNPGRPLKIEKRGGIMKVMAAEEQLVHVTLSGDINGDYVVKDEGPDGEITLVPDTSAEAILDRLGHTQATLAEFEAEYGAVLPPDGEG
jgi:hypothetical protein